MRVVIDTNVFISAALKDPSLPSLAVHRAASIAVLLKSDKTEAQLRQVLNRPYFNRLIGDTTRGWLFGLMATAESIPITDRITACRDPTDDKFLELAVHGKADVIISGDNDLLVLHPFRGIPILAPAGFLLT